MKTNHRRGFRGRSYPSKSGTYFEKVSAFADVRVGYGVDNDTARCVAHAKGVVTARIRFHEKAATRRLAAEHDEA